MAFVFYNHILFNYFIILKNIFYQETLRLGLFQEQGQIKAPPRQEQSFRMSGKLKLSNQPEAFSTSIIYYCRAKGAPTFLGFFYYETYDTKELRRRRHWVKLPYKSKITSVNRGHEGNKCSVTIHHQFNDDNPLLL